MLVYKYGGFFVLFEKKRLQKQCPEYDSRVSFHYHYTQIHYHQDFFLTIDIPL